MNLHLIHDGKFLPHIVKQFDRFYPSENVYVFYGQKPISTSINTNKLIQVSNDFSDKLVAKEVLQLIPDGRESNLFLHFLSMDKCDFALKAVERKAISLFWIFYGADLYNVLERNNKYKLLDEKKKSIYSFLRPAKNNLSFFLKYGKSRNKLFQDTILKLDFFCFWNELDFELVKRHYTVSCAFKNFIYQDLLPTNVQIHAKSKDLQVLVNHSGSLTGNHFTVIKRISEVDVGKEVQIFCPLSYGNPTYIEKVIAIGERLFSSRFKAQVDFLPIDDYYRMLNIVPVAVFGHRRQEAAGNVFYLLAIGGKVFLRESNNMLEWLRSRRFVVFSFERDLNSISDLLPLGIEDAIHNRNLYNVYFSKASQEEFMMSLITKDVK